MTKISQKDFLQNNQELSRLHTLFFRVDEKLQVSSEFRRKVKSLASLSLSFLKNGYPLEIIETGYKSIMKTRYTSWIKEDKI